MKNQKVINLEIYLTDTKTNPFVKIRAGLRICQVELHFSTRAYVYKQETGSFNI